jgi:hypothetical protein
VSATPSLFQKDLAGRSLRWVQADVILPCDEVHNMRVLSVAAYCASAVVSFSKVRFQARVRQCMSLAVQYSAGDCC